MQPDLGIKKILIVDWDVHHGNGTQKMFWKDPRVLFFSVHRYVFATSVYSCFDAACHDLWSQCFTLLLFHLIFVEFYAWKVTGNAFVARHEYGSFYPAGDDGDYNMVGEGPGEGFNINVPWEQGRCGDADYLAAWDHILIPVAKEFNPDIILLSAGFDAGIYGLSISFFKAMSR